VQAFNISRINTRFGIFRVSGLWRKDNLEVVNIEITSIEIMGTDGWVLLDQSSDKVINLVADLIPIVQTQILTDHS
jgi:hypothetical protein